MKKILYLVFAFYIFNLFHYNIYAETEKIASCVYDSESVLNEYAPSKIILNVDSDYNISFDHFTYQQSWNTCDDSKGWTLTRNEKSNSYICYNDAYSQTQIDSYDFIYGDFVKDTVFSCENLPILYYNNELNASLVTLSHYINKTSGNHGIKYNLNLSESTVNVENPTETEDEEGWLKVCHYNNVTLKFNKSEYDLVNAYPIKKGYPLEGTDLLKYIADNNYSCPFKYCYYTANGQEDIDGNIVYTNLGYFINDEPDYISGKTCYYSADYSGDEFTCGGIQAYMNEFDTYNKNYTSTGQLNYLNLRNQSEEKVKSFCQSVLVNSNYNDSNNCVKECISIDEVIANRVGKETSGTKVCGLSEKLIIYIANIVKWVKYIIPVIVIVLGILDFIKAISADKEDEMKKAQGRFVKRLIAAALIFIIPFIIEFVLEKMGFASNGCGIIDL